MKLKFKNQNEKILEKVLKFYRQQDIIDSMISEIEFDVNGFRFLDHFSPREKIRLKKLRRASIAISEEIISLLEGAEDEIEN